MLKKLLSLFSKDIEEEEHEEEELPDFTISYSLTGDSGVYIHVDARDPDFDPKYLAILLNYLSSLAGQKDTLDIIKGALEEQGKHESFIGHFFTLKRKEADLLDEIQGSPCIDPLDML